MFKPISADLNANIASLAPYINSIITNMTYVNNENTRVTSHEQAQRLRDILQNNVKPDVQKLQNAVQNVSQELDKFQVNDPSDSNG